MTKLAFFVEGYTELVFLENLIIKIVGSKNVTISCRKIRGGRNIPRYATEMHISGNTEDTNKYVLIYDCGGDTQVKTRILEEHESLSTAGYTKVIGLRDVAPTFTLADIPKLRKNLLFGINTALIPVELCLSVMEFEAWLLAEHTHFSRLSPLITYEKITKLLNIDIRSCDVTQRPSPQTDLNSIYSIGGMQYSKSDINNTLSALNYHHLCLTKSDNIPDLKTILRVISDAFL